MRPRRNRRGFTLAELMVAMTILAMVGTGIASMLAAVSRGTAGQEDERRLAARQRVVSGRLDAAVRASSTVLARTSNMLVLWTGDTRVNGRPDLSELRRLEWRPTTAELWSYTAPSDLPEYRDRSFEHQDDFARITAGLKGTADLPGRRWGTGIVACSFALDEPVARDAALVRYELTLQGNGAAERVVRRAAALRGRQP